MKIKIGIGVYLFLALLSCFTAKAQFGLGFRLGSVNWATNYGITEDGKKTEFYSPSAGTVFGLETYYIIKPKIKVNLIFDLVCTAQRQTTELIFSGTSNQSYIFVNVTHPATMVRFDFQYAFVHDFLKKGLAFYGIAGLSANTYYYTTSYGAVIPGSGGNTFTSSSDNQNRTYAGGSIHLGLGLDYAFNLRTHLFAEFRGCSGETTNFTISKLNKYDLLPNNFNPGYGYFALGMRFNWVKAIDHEAGS